MLRHSSILHLPKPQAKVRGTHHLLHLTNLPFPHQVLALNRVRPTQMYATTSLRRRATGHHHPATLPLRHLPYLISVDKRERGFAIFGRCNPQYHTPFRNCLIHAQRKRLQPTRFVFASQPQMEGHPSISGIRLLPPFSLLLPTLACTSRLKILNSAGLGAATTSLLTSPFAATLYTNLPRTALHTPLAIPLFPSS